jgi:hypothetical protein
VKQSFIEPPYVNFRALWVILTTLIVVHGSLWAYIYNIHREMPHRESATRADLSAAVADLKVGQQNIYNLFYTARPTLTYPSLRGNTRPSP